ncbi:MAG: DNA cytosine methyltransferase [Nanoarchaeota archaeon]|nr:DNA cytosine methyltransferase [Nanoarchaeota archaeon]
MVPLKILDLFAGVGGFSLGFELIRDVNNNPLFELYRAVEIDKFACETLKSRHGEEKVIEGDITKFHIANRIIKECRGNVSVIVGGIPCQSFSLIGPRSGFGKKIEKFKVDKRDVLYEHFRDIVAEIKPNIIAIENVKGILSKKDLSGNLIINKLISDFEKWGYNFENETNGNKFIVVNSADFGVPQKRERVIIVGIKKSWKNVRVPSIRQTHFNPDLKNANEFKKNGLLPYVSLYEAIGDLPKLEAKITDTGLSKNMRSRVKKKNEKVFNGMDKIELNQTRYDNHINSISKSGKLFLNYIKPNGYKYIDHHIARSQQLTDIDLFKSMKPGETAKDFMQRSPKSSERLIKYKMNSFLDKYRKQSASMPCTTIFAHLEKDGNRFIHYNQARTITPREAARIQSFPDDFTFAGPNSKKFKQIGNAIPPLLSKAIAQSIVRIL